MSLLSSRLEGKRIVVVGGTSGVGFALTEAALRNGAESVVIASSSSTNVQKAKERLPQDLGKIESGVVDVSSTKSLQAFLDQVGTYDHLAWTAGNALPKNFPDVDLDACRNVFDTRFWGPLTAAQYSLRQSLFRKGASFTLSSGAFKVPPKGFSVAASVGSAAATLSRSLAVDLAPHVRVNCVYMGVVATELWGQIGPKGVQESIFADFTAKLPVGHVAQPEEITEAFLCSMVSTFMTGAMLTVDGGHSLLS